MASTDIASLIKSALEGEEVLPDGTYEVTLGKASYRKNNNGKEQVGLNFTVSAGPLAGRSTFLMLTFSPESPGAIRIFVQRMLSLGVPKSILEVGEITAIAAAVPQGSTGTATFGSREWQGRTFQELKAYTAGAGGVPAPAAPATAPSF